MRNQGMAIIVMLGLIGCVTDRTQKPLLTDSASRAIAARCGAVSSEFHRLKRDLPFASFVISKSEMVPEDEVSPTVRCLGIALDAYRHSMLSFAPEQ